MRPLHVCGIDSAQVGLHCKRRPDYDYAGQKKPENALIHFSFPARKWPRSLREVTARISVHSTESENLD